MGFKFWDFAGYIRGIVKVALYWKLIKWHCVGSVYMYNFVEDLSLKRDYLGLSCWDFFHSICQIIIKSFHFMVIYQRSSGQAKIILGVQNVSFKKQIYCSNSMPFCRNLWNTFKLQIKTDHLMDVFEQQVSK